MNRRNAPRTWAEPCGGKQSKNCFTMIIYVLFYHFEQFLVWYQYPGEPQGHPFADFWINGGAFQRVKYTLKSPLKLVPFETDDTLQVI